MRLGRFLIISLALGAIAFCSLVTATGWERIVFYTDWVNRLLLYPMAIVWYAFWFCFAIGRTGNAARAAVASLITVVISAVLLIGVQAYDQVSNARLASYLKSLFGMSTVIVEEDYLNTIAVMSGVTLPLLFIMTTVVVTGLMKRKN